MNRTVIGASAGTLALVATLVLAGSASAEAATARAPHRVIPAASCWTDVSTGQSLCVRRGVDLIAAVQAATGDSFVLPVGAKIGNVTITAARAKAARLTTAAVTQTLVSAIYEDINYGGDTHAFTVQGTGCDWGFPNLGSIGWNDKVSSFKSFAGCTTALFKNIGYDGTRVGYSSAKATLGSMNDQASSWSTQ